MFADDDYDDIQPHRDCDLCQEYHTGPCVPFESQEAGV